MARDDWFRNIEWNSEIEASFRARLQRARDKTQYLRIQASYLAKRQPETALRLLGEYFQIEDAVDRASAHVTRAEAHLALANVAAAIDSYEAALQQERVVPKWRTQACVMLPMLIVRRHLTELYPRALEVLEQHLQPEDLLFPIARYQAHGARAIIFAHFQRYEEARSSARLALAAASETQSGFRHHQSVGVVATADDDFGGEIGAIAKS